MNLRETHARAIAAAVDRLRVLNVESPMPERCLEPALQSVIVVWGESANYIDADTRAGLRAAIVSMRGLTQSVARHDGLTVADVAAVRRVEASLALVADSVRVDPRTPRDSRPPPSEQRSFSPLGLRMTSLRELAGVKPFVVAAADMHARSRPVEAADDGIERQLQAADALHSRLQTKVGVGASFVIARGIPLLAYPKGRVDDAALRRADVRFTRIPGAYLQRNFVVSQLSGTDDTGAILLHDQVLLGLPPAVLSDQKALNAAVEAFSRREGAHTNPLSDAKSLSGRVDPNRAIRSPGNPLAWLWMAPTHAVSSGVMAFRAAAFPWRSAEAPEARSLRERQERTELRRLLDQQDSLRSMSQRDGRKRPMNEEDLRRIAELQESLREDPDRPREETPAARAERLAALRAKLEDRVRAKFGRQMAQVADGQSALDDLGPASAGDSPAVQKQRKTLRRLIADLRRQIDAGREDIAREMRGK